VNKPKEIFYKNRHILIIAASSILLIVAAINVYFTLVVDPTSNDECLWVPKEVSADSSEIFISTVKINGVAWNAGIRDGDQLLAINGTKVFKTTQAQEILNVFREGDYVKYTLKRDGKIFTADVHIKKLISVPDLAGELAGLFWLIIGFVVLMAKMDGFVQKLFYSVGVGYVLASMSFILRNSHSLSSFPLGLIIVSYLFSLGVCYTPFLIMYFFWNFPKPFHFLEKKWVKPLVFIVPAILSMILIILAALVFGFKTLNFKTLIIFLIVLGFTSGVCHITAFISLIINYRKLKTKKEKKPIMIILIAYAIAIAASFYTITIAPAISDTIFNSPEYYAPIILVVLFPLAFGYSIFKYQLMDVSVVIKNTIVYGLATVALAIIYFLVIYVMGQSISTAIGTQYQAVIAGIFFVAFALVFQSTKDKFQDFLTAKFYPEQSAYQKVLLRFSNEISTVVGLDNILDSMKETFIQSLKISTLGICINNDDGSGFVLVRSQGFKNNKLSLSKFQVEEFLKSKFQTSGSFAIDRDDFVNVFPEQASNLIDEEIYTIIPMVIKNKPIGMILFGLKHSGSQFAGKDIELLSAAANQAAVAIENARLYNAESEKLRIEQDLTLARKIQQGLLPKQIPEFDKLDIYGEMIPAMQVGGDYFDVIPISNKKLFVVVADVSGKGLSASLYMTKVQTVVQFLCNAEKSPKDILIEINKRLYTSFERNSFVTMAIALFDMENMKVKISRAGHMPIIEGKDGEIHQYKTKGLGIGLESGKIFERTLVEEEIPLCSNQFFVFYSDGITEAMNFRNDLFGEEKLIEILNYEELRSSEEIVEELFNNINSFKGKAKQNDDMTVVVVKVNDET
jgi:phosphoserine phosphatase RsbU/P